MADSEDQEKPFKKKIRRIQITEIEYSENTREDQSDVGGALNLRLRDKARSYARRNAVYGYGGSFAFAIYFALRVFGIFGDTEIVEIKHHGKVEIQHNHRIEMVFSDRDDRSFPIKKGYAKSEIDINLSKLFEAFDGPLKFR